MKILFVTSGFPFPPRSGARLRDFHFLKQLAAQHQLTCVCLMERGEQANHALDALGIRMYAFAPAETRRAKLRNAAKHFAARFPLATLDYFDTRIFECVRALTAKQNFEIVQIEHSFLTPYLDALPKSLHTRALIDLHNVGARQYASLARLPQAPLARTVARAKAFLMRNWESAAAARFARVLVTSPAEAQWLAARIPQNRIRVVENGVDTETHLPRAANRDAHTLLFTGTMGYLPNADAMEWFCREIFPRIQRALPDAQLEIVGHHPNARVQALANVRGVHVRGQVPDVESFYRAARLVVVPLRAGGGTRLKILEAMAYGRAVVSTSIGAEGLNVRDGEDIVLADTADAFAARVIALWREDAERERIARSARELVEAQYAWNHIGAKLLSIYGELAG